MKLLFFLIGLILPGSFYAQNDSLSISGTVTDQNGETVPFVNITLLQDEVQLQRTMTDFDGNYKLTSVEAGIYEVKFTFVGYQTKKSSLFINSESSVCNETLMPGIEITAIVCFVYIPWFKKDETTTGKTFSREEILRMANF